VWCQLSQFGIRPFFFPKGFKITFIPKQNKTKKKHILYKQNTATLKPQHQHQHPPFALGLRFSLSLSLSLSQSSLLFFFSDVYSSIVLLSSLSGTFCLSLFMCMCVCVYASDLFLILDIRKIAFFNFRVLLCRV
jgi:hypothetical protein